MTFKSKYVDRDGLIFIFGLIKNQNKEIQELKSRIVALEQHSILDSDYEEKGGFENEDSAIIDYDTG